ncbi:MAG: heme-binding protein [Mycobacterium sp.]|nr:heme-binding protein [Mycobacterium sp.]
MIKSLSVTVTAARGGISGVLAAGAIGVLSAATIALPSASADSLCTAAGLSSALGPVATATGDYLAAHPDANDAVTSAGSLPPQEGEKSIKIYFATHPQQWIELKAIALPLANLRQQCPSQAVGPPPDLGKLFDAMAS